ncbi:MAG: hypothetical protein ACW99G_19310, partial [Candidatus Thorarchaeota archaeon]
MQLLPGDVIRKLEAFRRRTGINDPNLDIKLTPDIINVRESRGSRFHFNYSGKSSFVPSYMVDMSWKYSSIGFIFPLKYSYADYIAMDFGNGDRFWTRDEYRQTSSTYTTANYANNSWDANIDPLFFKGFYKGLANSWWKSRVEKAQYKYAGEAQRRFFEGDEEVIDADWSFADDPGADSKD